MGSDTSPSGSPPTTAEIIDSGMAREGLTKKKLARVLGTTAGVIAAIRSDRLPVPLAWVPTIGGFVGHDKARLMTLAIADHGHDILVSIAEALLWERDAIAHEWIELLTEFGGGVLPDPNDVPKIVKALREAIGDSMETH